MERLANLIIFVVLLSTQSANSFHPLQVDHDGSITLVDDSLKEFKIKQRLPHISSVQKPQNDVSLPWRLPRSLLPVYYRVSIIPIIAPEVPDGVAAPGGDWDIPGSVSILVNCVTATNKIVMHKKDTSVNSIEVKDESGRDIEITSSDDSGEHSFFVINLGEQLQAGSAYSINIEFTSKINEALNGLYRSSYVIPETGETKWVATSQMEALHARQLFPCFDEPEFKAKFEITIGRLTKHNSLANTLLKETLPMEGFPGWEWDVFVSTEIMPTYLLAMIVSEFRCEKAANPIYPKPVQTCTTDHYLNRGAGAFASDTAEKLLTAFDEHFGEENVYPFPKMDSAAVPDFFFGAMENYGLNIYRESTLLYFPDEGVESERYTVARIIGHELVHQWFGNLVTCAWWTHIWLNEGFATYFAAWATEHTDPEFRPWERFMNDVVQRAMRDDSNPSIRHPIKIDEEEWAIPGDAMFWFDRIVYEKAGSVLRMLNGVIGDEIFTSALQLYLQQNQFNNARQDFLFSSIQTKVDERGLILPFTIQEIMETWTLQAGYPLIKVASVGGTLVSLSQQRFSDYVPDPENDNLRWFIPISYATASNPNFDPAPELWIGNSTSSILISHDTSSWIFFNAGAYGFYRVLYDQGLTNLIKEQLMSDHSVFSDLSRSQLLDDYFKAAYQRYETIETALELTRYLENERHGTVWTSVLSNLAEPLQLFSGSSRYDSLRDYLAPKVKEALLAVSDSSSPISPVHPIIDEIGADAIRYLLLLDHACALDDQDCSQMSLYFMNEWASTGENPLETRRLRELKPVVYCAGVREGGEEIFNLVHEAYLKPISEITPKQSGLLLNALACTESEALQDTLLEGTLLPDGEIFMTKSDKIRAYERLATTDSGRVKVMNFFTTKYADITQHFGSSTPIVRGVSTFASYSATSDALSQVENLSNVSGINLNSQIQRIERNIEWVDLFGPGFDNFLSSQ